MSFPPFPVVAMSLLFFSLCNSSQHQSDAACPRLKCIHNIESGITALLVSGASAKDSKAAGAAISIIPPTKMLAEWAPILLRGLYERNVRRQYCPTSLWLEPFLATEATQEGHFSAEAVVRALNQGHTTLVTSL